MSDSDTNVSPVPRRHPLRRAGDTAPVSTNPEDIAQATVLLRDRVNANEKQVDSIWELCGAGGTCEQRYNKLKRIAEGIPLWAKVTGGVPMALCGIIFAVYGFIGTRMYDSQEDLRSRMPVVESKQVTVYNRLDKIDTRFDALDTRLRENGDKLTEILVLHKLALKKGTE